MGNGDVGRSSTVPRFSAFETPLPRRSEAEAFWNSFSCGRCGDRSPSVSSSFPSSDAGRDPVSLGEVARDRNPTCHGIEELPLRLGMGKKETRRPPISGGLRVSSRFQLSHRSRLGGSPFLRQGRAREPQAHLGKNIVTRLPHLERTRINGEATYSGSLLAPFQPSCLGWNCGLYPAFEPFRQVQFVPPVNVIVLPGVKVSVR